MARLNVQAAVRWASGAAFPHVPMLLALSVTNQDGAMVEQLDAAAVRVGFQDRAEISEDTLAAVSDFRHNGPSFGGTGWYSCILTSPVSSGWLQDEVLLCVTVRHGVDRGQTILLARYHQIL